MVAAGPTDNNMEERWGSRFVKVPKKLKNENKRVTKIKKLYRSEHKISGETDEINGIGRNIRRNETIMFLLCLGSGMIYIGRYIQYRHDY